MKTTIDQHVGTHTNGARYTALVTIETTPEMYWLTDDDMDAATEAALADIHAAKVELEALDADQRAEARELLAFADCEMDNEAAVIRQAIKDSAR